MRFAKFYRGKVNYTVDGNASAIDVIIKVIDNASPVITDPGDKTYAQGEAITAFAIAVSDEDNDTVTVTVTGLPSGLSYDATTKQVSGTVAKDRYSPGLHGHHHGQRRHQLGRYRDLHRHRYRRELWPGDYRPR